ncbi:hypothetical protein ASPBRDRAFT_35464 [Aspergillus brasiliensis CBS 101740]|uniref:Secreted protein n=1 Tax=Aspergillus brasiliensis (strain CBS 101740 / IMI 381727 / IBT 21946) TaxID=767769 RepID=A0A1L9U317_ASPBC|nr:hypothetical protein ASPBRDRAFT_35464 [Aspergillus brasiliensis CBS 101740]
MLTYRLAAGGFRFLSMLLWSSRKLGTCLFPWPWTDRDSLSTISCRPAGTPPTVLLLRGATRTMAEGNPKLRRLDTPKFSQRRNQHRSGGSQWNHYRTQIVSGPRNSSGMSYQDPR